MKAIVFILALLVLIVGCVFFVNAGLFFMGAPDTPMVIFGGIIMIAGILGSGYVAWKLFKHLGKEIDKM